MMIVCPSCSTSYRIELSMLGPSGRQVRCSRCKSVWLATVDNVVTANLTQDALAGGMGGEENGVPMWGVAGRIPRPVPGESLSAASARPLPGAEAQVPQAFDAPSIASPEFDHVVVESAIPLPSLIEAPAAEIEARAAPHEDIEAIAARRERARRAQRAKRKAAFRWPVIPMWAVVLVLAASLGLLINFRYSIVSAYPQTAAVFSAVGLSVNLRGLAFEQIKSVKDLQEDVAILNVEGTLVNVTRRTIDIPRLRFSLRDATGREVYTWTALAPREQLGPGEKLAFRSRLASPPAEGQHVLIRFFNKRDAIAGGNTNLNPPNGPGEPKRPQ